MRERVRERERKKSEWERERERRSESVTREGISLSTFRCQNDDGQYARLVTLGYLFGPTDLKKQVYLFLGLQFWSNPENEQRTGRVSVCGESNASEPIPPGSYYSALAKNCTAYRLVLQTLHPLLLPNLPPFFPVARFTARIVSHGQFVIINSQATSCAVAHQSDQEDMEHT